MPHDAGGKLLTGHGADRAVRTRVVHALLLSLAALSTIGCGGIHVRTSRDEVEGTENLYLYNEDLGCVTGFYSPNLKVTVDATLDRSGTRTYDLEVTYENQDWIFIAPGESLVLSVDGTKMVFSGEGSVNLRSKVLDTLVSEQAWYHVTVNQLRDIANAKDVKVKIIGEKGFTQGCFTTRSLECFREFLVEYPPSGEAGTASSTPPAKVEPFPMKHVGKIGVDWTTDHEKVLLTGVDPKAAAGMAGLLAGDIITAFDGQVARRASEVHAYIRARPGVDIKFSTLRSGVSRIVTVRPANVEVMAGLDAEDMIGDMLDDGNKVSVAVVVGSLINVAIDPDQLEGWKTHTRSTLKDDEERSLLLLFEKQPQFSLVDRQHLRDITSELALQQTGAISEATMAKLGQLTGATHLLIVELKQAPHYQSLIDTRVHRLIDVETGKTIAIGEMVLPH